MTGEGKSSERQFPWCLTFLVGASFIGHTCVLFGNLLTSKTFTGLGASTGGWSHASLQLASAFDWDLNKPLERVTTGLKDTLLQVRSIQVVLDSVSGGVGTATEGALKDVLQMLSSTGALQKEFHRGANASLLSVTTPTFDPSSPLVAYRGAGNCGPRGEEARAEISTCVHGHKVISEVKSQLGEAVVEVRGCSFFEYTVYECLEDEDTSSLLQIHRRMLSLNFPAESDDIIDFKEQLTNLTRKELLNVASGDINISELQSHLVAFATSYLSNHDNITGVELKSAMKSALTTAVTEIMEQVDALIVKFWETIEPALKQVGVWVLTFSDKIQSQLAEFGTTLDKVQKLFDQAMQQLASVDNDSKKQMLEAAFIIFDQTKTGTVNTTDLKLLSARYGIEALSEARADALLAQYDTSGDGEFQFSEFEQFVCDPSLPNVLPNVMRAFASKIASVGGQISSARLQDEVATNLVLYLDTISQMDAHSLLWISDRLSNGSVPMNFTADVLKNLVLGNFSNLASSVVYDMYSLHPEYTGECLEWLSNPEYNTIGADDRPTVVAAVTQLVLDAEAKLKISGQDDRDSDPSIKLHRSAGASVISSRVQRLISRSEVLATAMKPTTSELVMSTRLDGPSLVPITKVPGRAAAICSLRVARHEHQRMERLINRHVYLYSSLGGQHMRNRLLGGISARGPSSAIDSIVDEVAANSVMAKPQTLEFAQFLNLNASKVAAKYQRMAFEYTMTSSSAVDSFAAKVQGLVKKVSSFINSMKDLVSEAAIEHLRYHISNFSAFASMEVLDSITDFVNQTIDSLDLGDSSKSSESIRKLRQRGSSAMDAAVNISQTVLELNTYLSDMVNSLPVVIQTIKEARTEVSSVSAQIESVFAIFKVKGPKIFGDISAVYSKLWTAYYVFFAVVTTLILIYGYRASGFLGGNSPDSAPGADGWEEPQGIREKLFAWCRTCVSCCHRRCVGCADTQMCFWAFIIILESLTLVLFLIAILLCLVSGIKSFVASSCASIYILGVPDVCAVALSKTQSFLPSFLKNSGADLQQVCLTNNLLTCRAITDTMKKSFVLTVIGGIVAAVCTFQLIIESAVLHERARWSRFAEELDAK